LNMSKTERNMARTPLPPQPSSLVPRAATESDTAGHRSGVGEAKNPGVPVLFTVP
jgi:hypothetical protein